MKKTVKQKIEELGIHAIGSFILVDESTGLSKWYITWGENSSDVFQRLQGIIEDMFVSPENDEVIIHPNINCGCTHTLSTETLRKYYEALTLFLIINIDEYPQLPIEVETYYFIEVSDIGIELYSKTKKNTPNS